MTDDLYMNLEWLPKPPKTFRERCRSLGSSQTAVGAALRELSKFSLDENHMLRLSNMIEDLRKENRSFAPLTPFKLGVLGNGTLDPIISALTATAPRYGIALECVKADFAQTLQEALSPDSIINRSRPDAVLIALDHRGLPIQAGIYDAKSAGEMVTDSITFVQALRDGFRKHSNALSIVQTVAPPPEALFGSFDRVNPGAMHRTLADFNTALVASIEESQDVVFDVATLASTVGLAQWHSPTQWNLAKLGFDARALPLYADNLCRIIGALRGKSRKCLILDLDNTVWGGVIGDDGLEGIVIGQGDATGEAFLEVQRLALALRARGVVLAVSSKNTDSVARRVFAEHPEMLLRENHIAVFQANWSDKATNISTIAQELSLGLDAMVFLDDNPVERGLVREMLPDVAVPELPENPALYARTLAAAGYFESTAFSQEDRRRADLYQDNARRVSLQKQVGDIESYLQSLQMEIGFRPFDATGRSRISQLINKSNQFNLTTRRYTELDVAQVEADPLSFSLQVRLKDAFGDNGMISVIICQTQGRDWEIDTWLMSCRVLGRRVEHMVLREIVHHARNRGIQRLIGVYIPTEKNAMVSRHYENLGFNLLEEHPDGSTRWELSTQTEVPAVPMAVTRDGFEDAVSSR